MISPHRTHVSPCDLRLGKRTHGLSQKIELPSEAGAPEEFSKNYSGNDYLPPFEQASKFRCSGESLTRKYGIHTEVSSDNHDALYLALTERCSEGVIRIRSTPLFSHRVEAPLFLLVIVDDRLSLRVRPAS